MCSGAAFAARCYNDQVRIYLFQEADLYKDNAEKLLTQNGMTSRASLAALWEKIVLVVRCLPACMAAETSP